MEHIRKFLEEDLLFLMDFQISSIWPLIIPMILLWTIHYYYVRKDSIQTKSKLLFPTLAALALVIEVILILLTVRIVGGITWRLDIKAFLATIVWLTGLYFIVRTTWGIQKKMQSTYSIRITIKNTLISFGVFILLLFLCLFTIAYTISPEKITPFIGAFVTLAPIGCGIATFIILTFRGKWASLVILPFMIIFPTLLLLILATTIIVYGAPIIFIAFMLIMISLGKPNSDKGKARLCINCMHQRMRACPYYDEPTARPDASRCDQYCEET